MVSNMKKYFASHCTPVPFGDVLAWTAVLSGVHHLSYCLSLHVARDYQDEFSSLVIAAEFIIFLFLLRSVLELAATPFRRIAERYQYDNDEANRVKR
jgi:hypothetical protein